LVECTLFIDKSKKNIEEVLFLEGLEDLPTVHEWSWGGMTLIYLYHYLSEAIKYQISSTGCYITIPHATFCNWVSDFIFAIVIYPYNCVCFFQAWTMEHFIGMFQFTDQPGYATDMPHIACFDPWRVHSKSHPHRLIFDLLDMEEEDVIFSPYDDHSETIPFKEKCWYLKWIMCG
jgi:hypothetical protein